RPTSPIWPRFSIRSSRITSMSRSSSSLDHVGQQPEIARALDGTRQFALLLGRNRGDPTRHDLASFGDEAAQKLAVLVVDLRRVGAGEGTGLAATEEGTARCAPLADDLNAHGST